jgi:hypothetical protein
MHPKDTEHKGHKQHHHGHHAAGGRAKRAKGGHVDHHGNEPHEEVYAGEGSNVEHEALVKTSGLGHDGRKKGGRVAKKSGGRTKKAFGGIASVEGGGSKRRLDRPGRKRGGRAGADKTPLTSASHTKSAEGHHADTGMAEDDTHSEGT